MHRRAFAPLSLLVVVALALGACGGTKAPTLTDPSEIVTKAFAMMQKAKTIHLAATVDGTLKASLLGAGSADLALTGTTLEGDFDIANGNAHMKAAVPAFLGLTADIIQVGKDTYTRISLTGDKYQKSATTPGDPTNPATALEQIKAFLAKPEISPVKKDDASCGSKSCYQVEVSLTAAELTTLLPGQTLGDATVVVTLLVDKDTLYPMSATAKVSGTTVGDLTLKVTLSDWDKTLTITAPSADQIDAAV